MGGSLNVLSIEILDRSIDRDFKQKLEMALLSAVNSALQKAALNVGRALTDLSRAKRARVADRKVQVSNNTPDPYRLWL